MNQGVKFNFLSLGESSSHDDSPLETKRYALYNIFMSKAHLP